MKHKSIPYGYHDQELTDPAYLTPKQRRLREEGARIYLGGRIEWPKVEIVSKEQPEPEKTGSKIRSTLEKFRSKLNL